MAVADRLGRLGETYADQYDDPGAALLERPPVILLGGDANALSIGRGLGR